MIWLTALFLANSPMAESGSVSSANASYNGNALILKGQVVIDHNIGTMQADEAILERQETGKDFPFSLIHLKHSISLALKEQGKVRCQLADFDFAALTGTLQSDEAVLYTDTIKKKKKGTLPFSLSGKNVELLFSAQQTKDQKTEYGIREVIAKDRVEAHYWDGVTLFSDRASYVPVQSNQPAPHLHATAEAGNFCRIIRDHEWINAETIAVDLIQSITTLQKPSGEIHSFANNVHLKFSANTLVWNHAKQTMVLQAAVHVEDPALGTLDTTESLEFAHTQAGQLTSIRSRGRTQVSYQDMHKFIAYGPVHIDYTKNHATVESPLINGVVPPGQQVCYTEKEISVFGNSAQIEYSTRGIILEPVSISMKGDVKIYSGSSTQVGIADRLSFSPQTKTFILAANPGKKVVFVNEGENVRISAQEVHITEDPISGTQAVKGIGNVQMSLSAEEESLINQILNRAPTKEAL